MRGRRVPVLGGLYGPPALSRFVGPKTEQIRLIGNKGLVDLERGRIRRLTDGGDVVESLSREQVRPSAVACVREAFIDLWRS